MEYAWMKEYVKLRENEKAVNTDNAVETALSNNH